MCGEQPCPSYWLDQNRGSPPRVRGTVCALDGSVGQLRITPACAGNSGRYGSPGRSRRDHPRVCGEQPISIETPRILSGSPPRVRGTVVIYIFVSQQKRITPACAGNSIRSEIFCRLKKDHPRVCGEQLLVISIWTRMMGSPPRVRGTGYRLTVGRYFCRITPACAGNSRGHTHFRVPAQDHPRVCGEQKDAFARDFQSEGSPPRVRGTANACSLGYEADRITPACAGNSRSLGRPLPILRDHPRVCGEQRLR